MIASVFIHTNDPLLYMKAEEVPESEILSEKTQEIIDRMFEMSGGGRTDTKKPITIGLAAPQIGISKQIILVDVGVNFKTIKLGELTAYINPKIIWYSAEREDGREGCASVDSHISGIVSRAVAIKIMAFDRQGNPVVADFTGDTARIFQHEFDHLDGILFPDRIGPEGTLHWVKESEYQEYRKTWKTWDRKCPWDIWLAMKEGKPYMLPVSD